MKIKLAKPQIEVIGIDHIYVAVSKLGRSEKFYDRVMTILGFRKKTFMNEAAQHVQYYNRHFGFVLRPSYNAKSKHNPLTPGMHHFCFRVEGCAMVDSIAKRFKRAHVVCSKPQFYPEYAADYYSIFFSDPDGIRLEITNFRKERRERFKNWNRV